MHTFARMVKVQKIFAMARHTAGIGASVMTIMALVSGATYVGARVDGGAAWRGAKDVGMSLGKYVSGSGVGLLISHSAFVASSSAKSGIVGTYVPGIVGLLIVHASSVASSSAKLGMDTGVEGSTVGPREGLRVGTAVMSVGMRVGWHGTKEGAEVDRVGLVVGAIDSYVRRVGLGEGGMNRQSAEDF